MTPEQEGFRDNLARCLNQAWDLGWIDKDSPQSIAEYVADFIFHSQKNALIKALVE